MHVNVSARHFAAPGLAGTVSRALRRSGLQPDQLVLEIAETMFTGEGQIAMAQLDDLRGVGVRIALDRFGTGYSSLAAIRQLPFDALKVDSSFLTELGESGTRDARLIEAMIGIGHSLGLPMTAAKVETEQQLRLLRSLGLDRAQGELFAPPLSADAALELVRSGRCGRRCSRRRSPAGGATGAGRAARRAGAAAHARSAPPRASHEATLSLGQVAQRAADLDDDRAPLGRRRAPRRDAHAGRAPALRRVGGAPAARRARPAAGRSDRGPAARAAGARARSSEGHGAALAELGWRGLYGDLRSGFFVDPDGRRLRLSAGSARSSSAARPRTTRCCTQATSALMRAAERGGASLLERHLALERFCETATRALARRSCPREEIIAVRRLFAVLEQRQLADAA